ncbi:hypothetical protein GCM10009193_06080 [Shewanella aestuarii]|nr:hypothetical protein GCM10009193_06080 [Shewanella aestuarii]
MSYKAVSHLGHKALTLEGKARFLMTKSQERQSITALNDLGSDIMVVIKAIRHQ